jgi:hypothetical protein
MKCPRLVIKWRMKSNISPILKLRSIANQWTKELSVIACVHEYACTCVSVCICMCLQAQSMHSCAVMFRESVLTQNSGQLAIFHNLLKQWTSCFALYFRKQLRLKITKELEPIHARNSSTNNLNITAVNHDLHMSILKCSVYHRRAYTIINRHVIPTPWLRYTSLRTFSWRLKAELRLSNTVLFRSANNLVIEDKWHCNDN